ncbi:MAG: DUF4097 family beta strand repeat-containing protein [Acidobacteriota bacterium]
MNRKLAVAVMVAAAAGSWAAAQTQLNERKAAAPDGAVEISNVSGSVRVIGWDRGEVEVTGTLGRGSERLEFSGAPGRTVVKVILPRHAHDVDGSDLTVRVPAGSRLEVDTVSADVEADGLRAEVEVETVSGTIRVAEGPSGVRAASVSGDVEVAAAGPVRAKSVSGTITVRGASRTFEAASVSGAIRATVGTVESAELETTSGSIRFEGDVAKNGRLEAKTMSGSAVVTLPASLGAEYTVKTFSGDIDNELGPAARRTSEYGPGRELDFTTGDGGARVRVTSFSGSVTLRKR